MMDMFDWVWAGILAAMLTAMAAVAVIHAIA